MSTQIPWDVIESITHGRIGRTMATCSLCSEGRRTPQKRHSKVLAVTLIEPEFAVYYCNHCEAQATAGRTRPHVSSILPSSNVGGMKRSGTLRKKSGTAHAGR